MFEITNDVSYNNNFVDPKRNITFLVMVNDCLKSFNHSGLLTFNDVW